MIAEKATKIRKLDCVWTIVVEKKSVCLMRAFNYFQYFRICEVYESKYYDNKIPNRSCYKQQMETDQIHGTREFRISTFKNDIRINMKNRFGFCLQ